MTIQTPNDAASPTTGPNAQNGIRTGAPKTKAPETRKTATHSAVLKTAVLVSGSGSNLQAIIDTWANQSDQAELSLVLSNRPNVQALQRASDANIPTSTLDHSDYATRTDFEAALHDTLSRAGINLIVLAGFMRILSPAFLAHWTGRIINVHPSLLPAYRGLNTHARALSDQQTIHGCSIHWVVPELDAGPLIAQASLQIQPEETPSSLQERVQKLEHQLYPIALDWIIRREELPCIAPVIQEGGAMGCLTEPELKERYTDWTSQQA
jgi:phosphoribosylglycinamide formyltransferase-1